MNPFHRRKYHAFLSHAHADHAIVDRLHVWLSQLAGVPVWFDAVHLPAGAMIATHLPEAITHCRAMIIILSPRSIQSGWVKEEYEAALGQRTQFKNFRIIPVCIEECEVPGFLQTTKRIDLSRDACRLDAYAQLLAALYYDEVDLNFEKTRDVYVSRTWRDSEKTLADYVCRLLVKSGFRLIGDAEDHVSYRENRVESIISSCGGLAAILPDRGQGQTSPHMLSEIRLAKEKGLPLLVVAESTVVENQSSDNLPGGLPKSVIRLDSNNLETSVTLLHRGIEKLGDDWRQPPHPHFSFYSTDFSECHAQRNKLIKDVLQRVSATPCVMGDQIREGKIQEVITNSISQASVFIADISGDNLNTCIEVGIARGANTRFHLVAREPRRRPPFMFRDQQVWHYADDVELLGMVHNIAYPYRRRVLNWELPQ
ncbi:MAG: toll/interleukin-1 receptor domain-containing protein [Nitrospirales bacterium]